MMPRLWVGGNVVRTFLVQVQSEVLYLLPYMSCVM